MAITLNDCINAVADKLKSLYPTYDIYIDEVLQTDDVTEIKDYFYIDHINTILIDGLMGKMRVRHFLDISYIQDKNENLDYFSWIDKMSKEFKEIKADGMIVLIEDVEFEKVDEIGHCTFNISYFIRSFEEYEKMQEMEANINGRKRR